MRVGRWGAGDSECGPECGDGGCGGDASRRGPGSRVVSQSGLPITEGMEGGDQGVGGSWWRACEIV